ncbi:MAG: hypothetical protein HY720_26690 [Planctomycetes bacterium]|nr:hypothetical protein [Planctomycetota bacterium]
MVGRLRFEIVFYVYLYVSASILAALVGRPWLGAVGLVTVMPFVALYFLRTAARGSGLKDRP